MSGLFSVVGAPSPKLYAVLNIVRGLVQVTIGEPVVVVANSLEALRKKFADGPTRKNRAVVLVSDYPQPDMWDLARLGSSSQRGRTHGLIDNWTLPRGISWGVNIGTRLHPAQVSAPGASLARGSFCCSLRAFFSSAMMASSAIGRLGPPWDS